MFTKVVVLLLLFSQGIAASHSMKRYEHDLTKTEVAFYAIKFQQLLEAGQISKLVALNRRVKGIIYQRRLSKCIKEFQSRDICENKRNFYIWVQMLAKNVMDGEHY